VPGALRRIVERGLARNPDRRHASIGAMVSALEREAGRARRRPRWLAAVGASIVVLTLLGVQRIEAHARASSCARQAAEIDAVWNPIVAHQLHVGLAATGAEEADSSFAKAVPWIERWTEEWKAARHEVCVATAVPNARVEGTDRALECFDARRDELDSLLALYHSPDRAMVPHLVAAAATLGRVESCADPTRIETGIDPAVLATDPSARADLRTDLHRARAQRLAGRYAVAADESVAVAEAADARGLVDLGAEAHWQAGIALERSSRFVEAETHLHRATVEAAALGLDDIAAEAASSLCFTLGVRLGRHEEALRWGEIAEMLLRRHGAADGLAGSSLHDHRATIELLRGELDEAERHYRESLRIREGILGGDHPSVANVLDHLARVHEARGELPAAVDLRQRALAIRTDVFGGDHPDVAVSVHDLAALALQRE
jgi:tetratricopeptide (TPR) repeat protein